MKIIVTHTSPDWDAIGSVWILRKFLPGWENAKVEFVPAGTRRAKSIAHSAEREDDPVEVIGEDEIVHVDTGMGPLDHHQTSDQSVSGAGRCWTYVQETVPTIGEQMQQEKKDAVSRLIKFIVDTDHFKEVFWPDAASDIYDTTILGLLEGLKFEKPEQDDFYLSFGIACLDALLHTFENKIWAEKDIKENGIPFDTRWGKGMGFHTINDTVLKLAQKMGYRLVVRKDPRKGYVRIKARPTAEGEKDIDLTLVYEKLSKIDPEATWYLHVSKKMLLNGTTKNPDMRPSKLTLEQIIDVLKSI
jgi:hypothetical protein